MAAPLRTHSWESDEALFCRTLHNLKQVAIEKSDGASMHTIIQQVRISAALQRLRRQKAEMLREAETRGENTSEAAADADNRDSESGDEEADDKSFVTLEPVWQQQSRLSSSDPRLSRLSRATSEEDEAKAAKRDERLLARLRHGEARLLNFPIMSGVAELRILHRTSERAFVLWQTARRAMLNGEIAKIGRDDSELMTNGVVRKGSNVSAAGRGNGGMGPQDVSPGSTSRAWQPFAFVWRVLTGGSLTRKMDRSPRTHARTESVPVAV